MSMTPSLRLTLARPLIALAMGLCGLVTGASAAPYAYIANYGNNSVSVIDTADNSLVTTVGVGNGPFGVAVSPDGTSVYVTNTNSNTVSVINTSNNTVTPVGGVTSPNGVAVRPDGKRVYVANYNSPTVSVINTADNSLVATVAVGAKPSGIAVSPDGARVYVTNYSSGNVSVIDTANNSLVTTVGVGSGPQGVVVSPDSTHVYVTNYSSKTVSVIDTSNSNAVTSVPVGTGPFGVAVSPDGTRVYVANQGSSSVSVIDTSNSNAIVATVGVGTTPTGVAVSPDGTRAYVTNVGSSNVSVIDTSNNTVLTGFVVGASPFSFGQFIGPATAPATPLAPTAAAGNASATVSFTAPANNGSAITGYTIQQATSSVGVYSDAAGGCTPATTNASTAVSCTATGLTNGTTYVFKVAAINGVGTSAYSPASGGVTPAPTIPTAPAIGTATAGNASASVAFTASVDNGGAAIDSYRATCGAFTGTGAASPVTVNGLTNGSAYTCTVAAHNSVGYSGESSASNSVIPATTPTVPAIGTATAGNASASVAFTASVGNGGAAIDLYRATCTGGLTGTSATSPIAVSGLTNGSPYTCTVAAHNSVGYSAESTASNSVTPVAPEVVPPAPTIPSLSPNVAGTSGLPGIIDMARGEGPSFMAGLVQELSKALGMPLQLVGQNATGSVILSGFNGGNLVFMPLSFQTGDSRANGIYPIGNGQYQVVVNGQSILIAPAVVRLDQLAALLPGVTASVADTGAITASLNGTTYVVQPGVAVQLHSPTGQSSLVLDADGLYRFTDALGNTQVLYPAFAAPAILRKVLQSIDPAVTMTIELDATATIVLGGVRYTLVPDLVLGGVPAEQVGQRYWTDGLGRYRMWVSIGQSQGLTVRP